MGGPHVPRERQTGVARASSEGPAPPRGAAANPPASGAIIHPTPSPHSSCARKSVKGQTRQIRHDRRCLGSHCRAARACGSQAVSTVAEVFVAPSSRSPPAVAKVFVASSRHPTTSRLLLLIGVHPAPLAAGRPNVQEALVSTEDWDFLAGVEPDDDERIVVGLQQHRTSGRRHL